MIHLNTTSILGAEDPRDSSLASIEKQIVADFHNHLSRALSGTNPNPNTNTLPVAPSATPEPAYNPFAIGSAATNPLAAPTAPPTTPGAPGSTPGAPVDSIQSFDDAYWASQPPAVQALRNMDDYTERSQLAAQLTAQGYNIDVPIMVYGWDPGKITAARESYGYTWVPSAMQKPIVEAPGVTSPGVKAAYDPNNPPAGSIEV